MGATASSLFMTLILTIITGISIYMILLFNKIQFNTNAVGYKANHSTARTILIVQTVVSGVAMLASLGLLILSGKGPEPKGTYKDPNPDINITSGAPSQKDKESTPWGLWGLILLSVGLLVTNTMFHLYFSNLQVLDKTASEYKYVRDYVIAAPLVIFVLLFVIAIVFAYRGGQRKILGVEGVSEVYKKRAGSNDAEKAYIKAHKAYFGKEPVLASNVPLPFSP